jgi:hypothetical protein
MQPITGTYDTNSRVFLFLDPTSIKDVSLVCKNLRAITQSPAFWERYIPALPVDQVKNLSLLSFKNYLHRLSIEQISQMDRYKITHLWLKKISEDQSNKINLQAAKLVASFHFLQTFYVNAGFTNSLYLYKLKLIMEGFPNGSSGFLVSDFHDIMKKKLPENAVASAVTLARDWRSLQTSDSKILENLLISEFTRHDFTNARDQDEATPLPKLLFRAYCLSLEIRQAAAPVSKPRSMCVRGDEQLAILGDCLKSSDLPPYTLELVLSEVSPKALQTFEECLLETTCLDQLVFKSFEEDEIKTAIQKICTSVPFAVIPNYTPTVDNHVVRFRLEASNDS